jgi:hypothetical protein
MDEVRYRHLKTLNELNDHPLFKEMVEEVSQDFSREMLTVATSEQRDKVYYEYFGFNRLLGKINAYVGELAMLKEKEEKNG